MGPHRSVSRASGTFGWYALPVTRRYQLEYCFLEHVRFHPDLGVAADLLSPSVCGCRLCLRARHMARSAAEAREATTPLLSRSVWCLWPGWTVGELQGMQCASTRYRCANATRYWARDSKFISQCIHAGRGNFREVGRRAIGPKRLSRRFLCQHDRTPAYSEGCR